MSKDASTQAIEERRHSISEAFHSFHQPLTSLHCGLELALAKPRSAAEYQKRLEDSLTHAAAVLELNRAVRDLVDAVDPGERFGTIPLAPLVAQVAEEVNTITEASGVRIETQEVPGVFVTADPMKLLRTIANLLMEAAVHLQPKSSIGVAVSSEGNLANIAIGAKGSRKQPSQVTTVSDRARAIRTDAAHWYVNTIGGKITQNEGGIEIVLPLAT